MGASYGRYDDNSNKSVLYPPATHGATPWTDEAIEELDILRSLLSVNASEKAARLIISFFIHLITSLSESPSLKVDYSKQPASIYSTMTQVLIQIE
jgi:hypothetical protein